MANTYRVTEIVGSSPEGVDAAIRSGIGDASRTLRASLRRLGEPSEIAWRRRGVRPRRVSRGRSGFPIPPFHAIQAG